MSAKIYEYVRNIAVFLIFTGFAGIIVPEGKLKGYINLALRLILVLMAAQPIISLAGGALGGTLSDMGLKLDMKAMSGEYAYNDAAQNARILDSYKKNLDTQLERIMKPYSEYSVLSAEFIVGESEDDFGGIQAVYIGLAEGGSQKQSSSLVRIEPVKIGSAALPGVVPSESEDKIKSVKKAISDFYNVPDTNIYITVQRKE